jgi:UDP-N-acetylglucosamine 2-epimerase (non-hydrolysing)
VLAHYQKQIEASDILKTLDLKKDRYFVASFHREENVDNPERLSALVESINALAATYDKPVILSVHPRTKQKLDALQVNLDERVRDLKPLGFFDYVQLQRLSYCTLSDSGTITEESAVMGFPAVTLRDTHERPEGMDAGVLVMTGISVGAVLQGVAMAKRQFEEGAKPAVPLDYQPTDVSWKVAKLIQSYVPYVRRRTWGEGS